MSFPRIAVISGRHRRGVLEVMSSFAMEESSCLMPKIVIMSEEPRDPEYDAWRRTSRRGFLKKSAVLATSAGILGSQGWIGSRAVEASDTVNLRYTLWDPNQEPYMKQAIKQFTDVNPNIKVSVEQYDWNHYWTKIQTETAGRNAADVQWAHVSWWPGWMAQGGYYLNLSKYIIREQDRPRHILPAVGEHVESRTARKPLCPRTGTPFACITTRPALQGGPT